VTSRWLFLICCLVNWVIFYFKYHFEKKPTKICLWNWACSDKRFIQAIILLNCLFCLPIYFVHFNWSFFEISLTFISPKPSPKPSDVQLLSTRHVTKVHLLQKFLDPQKHALIDNILPTCGNLSRFSFTWKMCVQRQMCIHFN
jgi:hypothetical protein